MAAKKTGAKKGVAKAAKAGAKKTAKKSTAPKKAAGAASAAAKPAKKAAALKLSDKQLEFLRKAKDAGEGGYAIGQKIEQRTFDALLERKLVKKGAKNKETGSSPYHISKLGDKHLSSSKPEGTV